MSAGEKRLINDAGYLQAPYMRGGLEDQSLQCKTHHVPLLSALLSMSSRCFPVAQRPKRIRNNIAQVNASIIRQGSEKGGGDLSLEANPPSLCSDRRDNPHYFNGTRKVAYPLLLTRRYIKIPMIGMTRWLQDAAIMTAS